MKGRTTPSTAARFNKAWMRLGGVEASFKNRAHFLGATTEAMRHMIDRATASRAKRGAGAERVDWKISKFRLPWRTNDQLLAVNEALEKFAALDPRQAV
jgi:hypothetical protein